MDALWQDLRLAVRGFRGTAVLAALCLALGIGGGTVVFSVMDAILFRRLPLPDADRLVVMVERHPERGSMAVRPGNFRALQARTHVFTAAGGELPVSITLNDPAAPAHLAATLVTDGWLQAVGVRPELGRLFGAADYKDPHAAEFLGHRGPTVLISDRVWRSRFHADRAVIGRRLDFDGSATTVVGVLPTSFGIVDQSDVWVPWVLSPADWQVTRAHWLVIWGRLRPGITRGQAQDDLVTAFASLSRTIPDDRNWTVDLYSLRGLEQGSTPTALVLLMTAVAALLLLACFNVANLLLAQAISRQRLMGIRVALGASPHRLLQYALTESVLVMVAGTVLGLLFAAVGIRIVATLPAIRAVPLAFPPRLNLSTSLVSCALGLVSTLIACVPPAVQVARIDVLSALKRTVSWTPGGRRLRSALIVSEAALAFALLATGTLMTRSLLNLERLNPGFDPTHVFLVDTNLPEQRTNEDLAAFVRRATAQIERLPGVQAVGVTTYTPLTPQDSSWQFDIEGRPASTGSDAYFVLPSQVTPDLFAVLRIPVLRGRVFSATDDRSNAPAVAVVSATAARRFWPHEDPMGHRVRPRGTAAWRTIVGVVGDTKQGALTTAPVPAMYVPFGQMPSNEFAFAVRTIGDPVSEIASVRRALHQIDPTLPIDGVRTMSDLRNELTNPPAFRAWLLGSFMILAVALAAVGLYGVLSEVVSERRRELGIRLALGAERRDVILLIVSDAGLVASEGVAAGLLLCVAGRRLLSAQLFGIGAMNVPMLALSGGFLLAVALLAAAIPARHAASVDPLVVLRDE